MNSYARMERIVRWLDEHALEQPSLGDLAELAGLGESQFHREFVRWTGVTPKAFVQCLTFGEARNRLVEGATVLEAALDAGLSGPGRLHDLCVSLEAASPGEIKGAGEGLEIRWGFAESPFGRCLLAETPRGICRLAFLDRDPDEAEVVADWPRARWRRDDSHAAARLAEVFRNEAPTGSSGMPPLRAWVKGSAFQVRVWRALLAVPEGGLTTYGRLAAALAKPGAARAVGSAVGANPIAFLIPCHRVIRETGAVSGYRWGVGRKRALLAWEGARRK